MTVLSALPMVLAAAILVVAVVLLIRGTRGAPRVAGIVGTALLVLSLLNAQLTQWFLDLLPQDASDDQLFNLLAARITIGGLVIGAGIVLCTYAILGADRRRSRNRSGRRTGSRTGSTAS